MQKILADNKKLYLFFLLLTLLFYGNSIKNDFSFDDSYVTVTNKPIKGQKFVPNHQLVAMGIKGIPKIWQSRYGHGNGTAYDYRPVVNSLFAIEYSFFGYSPHIDHFASILLYSLIAFLFYLILVKCLEDHSFKIPFALVCTILFIAHPIHTEVVDNIKCTDELLAMLFGLLAVFHSINFFRVKSPKYIFYTLIFLFLALYSKLTSALFIAIIPLVLFFFLKISKKQIVVTLIGLVACFFIYTASKDLFINEKEVRYFFHFENPLYTEQISFFAKILFALKTFGTYLKLLFFPYPLHFYYGAAMIPTTLSILDFEIILSLAFLLLSAWYCYKTKNKISLFGLLLFLVSMAPILNFTGPVAGIVGERLCFIASLGFIIFIVSIVFSFYKNAPTEISLFLLSKRPLNYLMAVVILFLFYTWNRNTVWKDEITLFENDAPNLERSAGANNLLANKYFDMLYSGNSKYTQKELVEKSLHHYNLAIQYDTSVYSAFNNAGVVMFSYLGKTKEALNYFIRATGVNPIYPQAYENIGNSYDKLGMPVEAIKNYRIAIAQNVMQHKSYVQLVRILLKQKRFSETTKLLEITSKLFPNDYGLTIENGYLLFYTGQFEMAATKFEQAYGSKKTKEIAWALHKTYKALKNDEKSEFFKREFDTFQR